MDVENKSEEEHNLSQATQGYEANQNKDGLGISSVCGDAGDEIELEENSGLEMPMGKSILDVLLLNGKDTTSLKTEAIKAELERRGLKKTGNKCTLVERLRAAIISEHPPKGLKAKATAKKPQLKEKTHLRRGLLPGSYK